MSAADRWSEALGEWAIPEEILASAPESPWRFPPGVFTEAARRAVEGPATPTHQQVVEVMPPGGTLLDVGSGAGAASIPTVPPTARIVAVDQDSAMLEAMQGLVEGRVAVVPIEGSWPAVHDRVDAVDVAVCANVAYNVADLVPFLEALTAVARRRVVLELTSHHPQSVLSPLWAEFWHLARPDSPTADDARAVVREVIGADVGVRRWTRSRRAISPHEADTVAWFRRRLCLPPARDPDVARALAALPELGPSSMVTLWWPGGR